MGSCDYLRIDQWALSSVFYFNSQLLLVGSGDCYTNELMRKLSNIRIQKAFVLGTEHEIEMDSSVAVLFIFMHITEVAFH